MELPVFSCESIHCIITCRGSEIVHRMRKLRLPAPASFENERFSEILIFELTKPSFVHSTPATLIQLFHIHNISFHQRSCSTHFRSKANIKMSTIRKSSTLSHRYNVLAEPKSESAYRLLSSLSDADNTSSRPRTSHDLHARILQLTHL